MLEAVHRDAPLARLRVEVRGHALALGVGRSSDWPKPGWPPARREAPRRIDLGQLEVGRLPSSLGTAQRMITGRLAALACVASSISRVN
jgi:hypothetical protein